MMQPRRDFYISSWPTYADLLAETAALRARLSAITDAAEAVTDAAAIVTPATNTPETYIDPAWLTLLRTKVELTRSLLAKIKPRAKEYPA